MVKPYEYQSECLGALAEHRKTNNSALIVMASGLGKTITSALDVRSFIIQQNLSDFRVLYLCHNHFILRNAMKEYRQVFGDEFSYSLFTCNDTGDTSADFVFASLMLTSKRLTSFEVHSFDYIVVDEAHHSMADTYRKAIEYFEPRFLLGMTATPKRSDTRDILDLFGQTVYHKDLPLALAEGLLAQVDYRLEIDNIDRLTDYIDENQNLTTCMLNREFFLPKRDEEIVQTIKQHMAEREAKKVMIFCPSITYANQMSSYFANSVVVHSFISKDESLTALDSFKSGEASVIVSVDMLNEGVDIPDADMVVFLRSTVSQIVFYQQLGRGLRKGSGEKTVLVLDFVANCERLFMIQNLFNEYRKCAKAITHRDAPREMISLNCDCGRFLEILINIQSKIRLANTYCAFDDERLLADLRTVAEILGKTPSKEEMNNFPLCASVRAYQAHFGSWNNAIVKAGLKPNCVMKIYSREELIAMLQEFGARIGHTPSLMEVHRETSLPNEKAFKSRIGPTWNDVLENAGFNVSGRKSIVYSAGRRTRRGGSSEYSDEVIERAMREYLAQSNGKFSRADYSKYAHDHALPSTSVVKKKYGGWNEAIKALGMEPMVEYRSSERLLEELRRLAIELGRPPGRRKIDACKYTASSKVYESRFGSVRNANIAAGII